MCLLANTKHKWQQALEKSTISTGKGTKSKEKLKIGCVISPRFKNRDSKLKRMWSSYIRRLLLNELIFLVTRFNMFYDRASASVPGN